MRAAEKFLACGFVTKEVFKHEMDKEHAHDQTVNSFDKVGVFT